MKLITKALLASSVFALTFAVGVTSPTFVGGDTAMAGETGGNHAEGGDGGGDGGEGVGAGSGSGDSSGGHGGGGGGSGGDRGGGGGGNQP